MNTVGFFLAVAWEEHGETIIRVAAVIAALGVIGGAFSKWVVKPMVRWGHRVERALIAVEKDLLTNNGGSTTRDAIDRIESRLTTLEDYVTNPKEG